MRQADFEWARRLGLEHPVVQAGMGGGCVDAALASAVSLAGGLGTIALMPPAEFRSALAQTRILSDGRPFAANLLMPFVRAAHVDACIAEKPAVVVRFYGYGEALVQRLHAAGIKVWQQVGDIDQASRALADGVDALIAQGSEAGGHLASGTLGRGELVRAIRNRFNTRLTVLAAGGIHDADSAARALGEGADGVVAGTRFLLTPEAAIHPAYKQRLIQAQHTVKTTLFSLGWLAPHRVADNAATRRWIGARADVSPWLRYLLRLLEPGRNLLPLALGPRLVRMQRLSVPLYSPFPLLPGMPESALELTPLYAGECVARLDALVPAAIVVEELARGCAQPD